MQTIIVLVLFPSFVAFYVYINFWFANWLIKRSWVTIKTKFLVMQLKAANFLASRKIFTLSFLISVGTIYGFSEFLTATTLWSFSFILLCLGIAPILSSLFLIDKLLFRFEPQSTLVKWGILSVAGLSAWFLKAVISNELNSIFPFDPSLMPFALSAGVFLGASGILAAFIVLLMLPIELFIFLGFFGVLKKKDNQFKNFIIGILSFGTFLGIFISANSFQKLALSPFRTLLITRIAYEFDFKANVQCYSLENGGKVPLEKGARVLLLGSTQKLGISARANELPHKLFYQIPSDEFAKFYPYGFRSVTCSL